LKEKQLPDLCADRIDYSLRTALIFKEATRKEIDYLLDNLIVKNNKWIFRNLKSAKKYAELFLRLNKLYYAGFFSAVMFGAVGDTLKYALSKRYISREDLYSTDKKVINNIKKYLKRDKKLGLLFNRMNGKIMVRNDKKCHNAPIFCKSRVVDPLCEYNGLIVRVSDVNRRWKETVKKELKPKKYFIKFEK
jgi:hypothetical protein